MIVVDNGGTFSEEDRANWPLANLTALISRPDNPGYGAAVNLARTELGESALLVLTHDAFFDKTLAEKLLDALPGEGVGAVGPVLNFGNDSERVFSAGGILSPSGRASHRQKLNMPEPYEVDWIDGAVVMFASQALESIGWLDEKYYLYFEDVDTGWRLNQAGWRNVLVPFAVGFQQPGAHPPYLGMRNMALFARKAGIPRLKSTFAALSRLTRESMGRLRRGQNPQLFRALKGLRDGYAGKSGPI